MRYFRAAAWGVLAVTLLAVLFANYIAPADYAWQDRESPSVAPSHHFLLGTDELGRDRFSRLVYGTRVALVLAPIASLLSVALAALLGGIAGYRGGWTERPALALTDLFLSLPWFFLVITVRAALPLNTSPVTSVMITFLLLGALGWAASARVLAAAGRQVRNADFMLQARAAGMGRWRLLWMQVLPNMKPVLYAQFWISIPVFILAEANLGLLGLGVNEPLPSWGGMLREMENLSALSSEPWRFAALILLVLVVSAFQI